MYKENEKRPVQNKMKRFDEIVEINTGKRGIIESVLGDGCYLIVFEDENWKPRTLMESEITLLPAETIVEQPLDHLDRIERYLNSSKE
ncbi:MAG: hypothetical protein A2161_13450 [Candidatus Schekmanbacteria bacterium RBG_13_48_7]|uniref:DUF4926 domain-containing protein n=1 Tax=Candidatus Schekmanbacteria bacterium RBG_13_48_7 TaxID=1817878 RepID=A0A1F7SAY8_9BACT|nr:MAG: hypothetical protein A2161_13450 [Candidatus Schekmanbacteria bacterium RBG_13_48_7]